MSPITKAKVHSGPAKQEIIRVIKSKRQVYTNLTTFEFRDADTRQIVILIPAIDLTAYGATKDKAMEMLKFSLEDFYKFLLNLRPEKLNSELKKMGFKRAKLKSKDFSKAYVDKSGELREFAVGNEVLISQLTT